MGAAGVWLQCGLGLQQAEQAREGSSPPPEAQGRGLPCRKHQPRQQQHCSHGDRKERTRLDQSRLEQTPPTITIIHNPHLAPSTAASHICAGKNSKCGILGARDAAQVGQRCPPAHTRRCPQEAGPAGLTPSAGDQRCPGSGRLHATGTAPSSPARPPGTEVGNAAPLRPAGTRHPGRILPKSTDLSSLSSLFTTTGVPPARVRIFLGSE